jgi:hypothetical protein
MRVLLDTNILIYREDDHVLDRSVQDLMKALSSRSLIVIVHPSSIDDLKSDPNEERRSVVLSKVAAYPMLESPPDFREDEAFTKVVVGSPGGNDVVDNAILYAVFKDAVDFLITEDRGIHKNASRLNIADRVLLINDALQVFGGELKKSKPVSPPALKRIPVHNLDFSDPIFDPLRREYAEFDDWLRRISREGRECWAYHRGDGSIGALLIYKEEEEAIDCTPPLPKKRRLKISLLKVTHFGHRIGELLMKLSIDYARAAGIREIYLTHFTSVSEDLLVQLISEYGFIKSARNAKGEDVFLKRLVTDVRESEGLSPVEIAKRFFPSFCDGTSIRKFIVPIRPEFHVRLFTDFPGRQTTIPEHCGEFVIEGNTIKKAYICHSKSKRMRPGDVVLFYRSQDWQRLTHLGVIEDVHRLSGNQEDTIMRLVAKRTAYSQSQICEVARKPTLVILFMQHFCLPNQLSYDELTRIGAIRGSLQSITEIDDDKYLEVRKRSGIDEHFAVR